MGDTTTFKEDEMAKIEVLDTFTDDHLPCVAFEYNGRRLALWWTDPKTIGALYFPDSPTAQIHLKDLLAFINTHSDEDIESQDFDGSSEWGSLSVLPDVALDEEEEGEQPKDSRIRAPRGP
jgi:hypothetical protein